MAVQTYTQGKNLLDEVASRITANIKRREQARLQLATAQTDLAAMATAYSTASAEIDALAAANPSIPEYQTLKAEKDLIVADRATEKTYVDDLLTAYDSVTSPY